MDVKERAILEMAAANAVVLPEQVETLSGFHGGDAPSRLDDLAAAGWLVRQRVLADGQACFRITRVGLDRIESQLPVPGLDLRMLRHDIGVVWLWLAARSGLFGEAEWVRSRRELIALGETDAPDLVLSVTGGWVAVYLQLTMPARLRLERALRRYANDPRFAAALFLVDDGSAVGGFVASVAAGLDLSAMTMVQSAGPFLG
jgi:hypothetical protein